VGFTFEDRSVFAARPGISVAGFQLMALKIPDRASIGDPDPRLYDALKKIITDSNAAHSLVGVNPGSVTTTPTNNGSINVLQGNGTYDAAINDPSSQRGDEYFIEYDTQKSFGTARLVHHGISPYYRANLGNLGTTYWRYYKMVKGSNVSGPINHGGLIPRAVAAGGTIDPVPQVPRPSKVAWSPGNGYGPIGATS
jgi:hypothetical protein